MLTAPDMRSILALMSRVESIKPSEARAFIALEDKVTQAHNALVKMEQCRAETTPAVHADTNEA